MKTESIEAGVDLGKESFDASVRGNTRTWKNNATGIRRFLDHLDTLGVPVRVSCEATGGYTRKLVLACLERGIPVALLNARHVRAFARAAGLLAKTNRIDATFDPPVLEASWQQRERPRCRQPAG